MPNELDQVTNPSDASQGNAATQAPDLGNSGFLPLQGEQSAPLAQQPLPSSGSKWQNILMGALAGLAGSGGAKNFGQGLAGGVSGGLQYTAHQADQKRQDQRLQMEQQQVSDQHAAAADTHSLSEQQLAAAQINVHVLQATYATMPKTLQDVVDQADMLAGAKLTSEGVPVVSPAGGVDQSAAQQLIMSNRDANPNSVLQFFMHSRTDGKYDVFQVQNPDKTNDKPVDVTIGYAADTGKPITKTYEAHSITFAQRANVESQALVNLTKQKNDLVDFKQKNVITTGGEIQVQHAKTAGEIAVNRDKVNYGGTGGAGSSSGLSGDQYLATLPPGRSALVTGVINGGVGLSSRQLQTKDGQALAADVLRVDPSYDISKQAGYAVVKTDFLKGKPATQLNAGGTAVQHLVDLRKLNTKESRIPGTADHKAYNNLLNTVTAELSTFYHLPDTDTTIKNAKENLGGFWNRDAAIDEQLDAMTKKFDGYQQQWDNAIPSPNLRSKMPGISEDSKRALASVKPDFVKSHPGFAPNTPQGQGSQSGQQSPALPQSALSQLSPGHVTTFANGQQWTTQNGNPVQVK